MYLVSSLATRKKLLVRYPDPGSPGVSTPWRTVTSPTCFSATPATPGPQRGRPTEPSPVGVPPRSADPTAAAVPTPVVSPPATTAKAASNDAPRRIGLVDRFELVRTEELH